MAQLREIVERQPAAYFNDFEKLLSSAYTATANNGSSSSSPLPHHPELNSLGSGFSSQSDLAGAGDDSSVRSSVESSKEVSRERSVVQAGQNAETMAVDVADVLKQYFRELPECLCTNKLSQTLIDIFMYLPCGERLEAVQYCMLLLDDENRDVLQCLLYFLHDVAKNAHVHKVSGNCLSWRGLRLGFKIKELLGF